jgi:hypothetical protein
MKWSIIIHWLKGRKPPQGKPVATKADVLKGLQLCCDYFQRGIVHNILFRPEFEMAAKINALLEAKEILSEHDIDQICLLVDSLERVEHYDGTGWVDYRMRLGHYIRLNGFEPRFRY